jgi:hypothetical protein
MNSILNNQMKCPKGNDLIKVMDGFKDLYGMPLVHGATDAMQIHVQKMNAQIFVTNFLSFKSKGYNIQMQIIMDHRKKFQDVYVGIPGFINGAQILKKILCPIEPLNRICLLLNLDKKVSNLMFYGTRAIPCYHG